MDRENCLSIRELELDVKYYEKEVSDLSWAVGESEQELERLLRRVAIYNGQWEGAKESLAKARSRLRLAKGGAETL